jgi:hypothetical protein
MDNTNTPIGPTEPAQRRSSPSIEAVSPANQIRAVWFCRVLAIFATVLACVYVRDQDSLTALAFGALGFGIAVVILVVHPGDREWVASLVFGIVGLAVLKSLFQMVGIG